MEKKINNKACPEVIMYCYTSCEYAKWLHSFLIVKRFKMGENNDNKNKQKKGVEFIHVSEHFLWKRGPELINSDQ